MGQPQPQEAEIDFLSQILFDLLGRLKSKIPDQVRPGFPEQIFNLASSGLTPSGDVVPLC